MTFASRLGWIYAAAGLVLAWNLVLGARIATAPGGRAIRELSGLCGLLVVPGAIIAVAGQWISLGRTVGLLTWTWPITLLLFVAQAVAVVKARRITTFVSIPLLLLNVIVATSGLARYAATVWPALRPEVMAAATTLTNVVGLAWGPDALSTPLALLLPVMVPAGPARWPGAGMLRTALATAAFGVVLLIALEYPTAVRANASFRRLADTPMRDRPRGDLALGLRLFPSLDRAPGELAIRHDLSLADSIAVEVLAVTITPAGATPAALDSLADVVAGLRADSVLLAVSLGWDRAEAAQRARNPVALADARLLAIDAIVRRLRPDVLVPAEDPMGIGTRTIGVVPLRWWTDYLTRASRRAHQLRPRTQVAVAASTWTPADSALYAWAAGSAQVDLLGFSFAPGFRGGGELQAQWRVAARWMSTNNKEHWITRVRTWPYVFGERAQQLALTGTLAWASAQPRVQAVIVDGAGDYDVLSGLRRSDGKLRPAVLALASMHRALREGAVVLR